MYPTTPLHFLRCKNSQHCVLNLLGAIVHVYTDRPDKNCCTALTMTKSLGTKYYLGIDHVTLDGDYVFPEPDFITRTKFRVFLHKKS